MKIIYKQGNLLECEEKIIVHGCNAQGTMGAGIAKEIKQKYPIVFESYKRIINFYKENKLAISGVMGFLDWVNCGDKIIVSAISQESYGRVPDVRYVSYDALSRIFQQISAYLSMFAKNFNEVPKDLQSVLGKKITLPYSIAMPKIGAGLAGGNWNIIERIIEEELVDIQPVVYYL